MTVQLVGPEGVQLWTPAMHGLIAATFNPASATNNVSVNTQLFTGRIPLRTAKKVTNLVAYVGTASGTLTTAVGGVWKLDGTLIARTASQTTGWSTTGLKTMALTAEAGQSLILPAADVLVGVLPVGGSVGFYGSASGVAALVNANLSSPALASSATSMGTLPTTLSGLGAFSSMPWIGLS